MAQVGSYTYSIYQTADAPYTPSTYCSSTNGHTFTDQIRWWCLCNSITGSKDPFNSNL